MVPWRRIILLGILICYIVAALFEFRSYTFNTTGTAFMIWPSWGWIVAIIASVLWFLAGGFASCAHPPSKKKPHAASKSLMHAIPGGAQSSLMLLPFQIAACAVLSAA